VAAVLVYAPLAFGAVEPWAFSLLAVGAYTALALALTRSAWERDFSRFRSPLTVVVLLGVALVAVQRIPWPASLLALASPRTVETYADAVASAGGRLTSAATPSLYRHGTSLALLKYSSYAALFAATLSCMRSRAHLTRLALVIISVAFLAAVLGMLQSLSHADRIYWFRRTSHESFFGPFAGRNQYAAYASICLFVGLALLMALTGNWAHESGPWWHKLAAHGSAFALLIFIIGVIGASVLWSLSRGGALAMLLAFAGVFALSAAARRKARPWLCAASGLAAVLAVVTYLGWGRIIERLATLQRVARDPSGQWRWTMFTDALRMGRQYLWLGTGAGAFASVYPFYRSLPTSALVESPHDEYAHVFSETGLPGLALVAAALVVLGVAVVRGLRRTRSLYVSGFLAGGAGAVLAVTIHSVVDYPMRSPAIAATMAVVGAMLWRAGTMDLRRRAERVRESRGGGGQRSLSTVAIVASGSASTPLPSPADRPDPLSSGSTGAGRRPVGALVLILLAWAGAVWFALRPFQTELALRTIARATARGEPTGGDAVRMIERRGGHIPGENAPLLCALGDFAAAASERTAEPVGRLQLAEAALQLHRRAGLAEPMNAAHPFRMARDYLALGRPDLAWRQAERAAELLPRDPWIRAHLAAAFAQWGYPATARHYVTQAEQLAQARSLPEALGEIKQVLLQLPSATGGTKS